MQSLVPKENDMSMNREKIELIKQTVAKGATDLELELFFHACKRTGLDPLMKQIYAIKRWNSQEKREGLTFQTGIDGYRLIADRTGQYAGSSDAEYEQGAQGYPDVARVTVTKLVGGVPCSFTASARWAEYCQLSKEGHPTAMWKKMPFLMLGKCAEALALRKAFPAELSGLYTHEEMQQADEPASTTQAYTTHKATAAKKIAELRTEAPKQADQWQDFLDYMRDDPDRTSVGKQLKEVLHIGTVADLQGEARRSFMLEFQKSCKETGVPCEEWVTA